MLLLLTCISDGCGISPDLRTAYPACDDILRLSYGREGQKCSNTVQTLSVYSREFGVSKS